MVLTSVLGLSFAVAAAATTRPAPVKPAITTPSIPTTSGTDAPISETPGDTAGAFENNVPWASGATSEDSVHNGSYIYSTSGDDGLGVSSGQIGHVWVIVLENHGYDANFTPLQGTANSYQATLPAQGALLTNYYGTGHSSLDNYTSMVSGQGPTPNLDGDCGFGFDQDVTSASTSTDIDTNPGSGSSATSGSVFDNVDFGQDTDGSQGCVFPDDVETFFNQLDDLRDSWKVYTQDLGGGITPDVGGTTADAEQGADPIVDAGTNGVNPFTGSGSGSAEGTENGGDGLEAGTADCGAAEPSAGAPGTTSGDAVQVDSSAQPTDGYVAKHNPLGWFDSTLPSAEGGIGTDCGAGLGHVTDQGDATKTRTPTEAASVTDDDYSTAAADYAKDAAQSSTSDVDSDHLAALFGPDDALYSDLQHVDTTPAFSYIVPNNCSNGHDAGGSTAGSATDPNNLSGEIDGFEGGWTTASVVPPALNTTCGTYAQSQFLSVVVPEIEASPAFKQNGLIVVTYDEAFPAFTNDNTIVNSQFQTDDAAGVITDADSAGETLWGRSLSWEPTGLNSPITYSPTGLVTSAGPGDDDFGIVRPASQADLESQLSTNIRSTTLRNVTLTNASDTIVAGVSTANEGEEVTLPAGTLYDVNGTQYTAGSAGAPQLYVGSISATPAGTDSFTLTDGTSGDTVEIAPTNNGSAPETGQTVTLSFGSSAADPLFDAFDATDGGGDAGAVLISPFIKPGTVSNTDYNHYSLLRSLEDIFGTNRAAAATCKGDSYFDTSAGTTGADLAAKAVCGLDGTGYLGFAAQPGLATFGTDVFTNAAGRSGNQNGDQNASKRGGTNRFSKARTVTKTTTVTAVYAVVPDVVGDSLATARQEIKASGLKVGNVTTRNKPGSVVVTATSLPAGTQEKSGATVSITAS